MMFGKQKRSQSVIPVNFPRTNRQTPGNYHPTIRLMSSKLDLLRRRPVTKLCWRWTLKSSFCCGPMSRGLQCHAFAWSAQSLCENCQRRYSALDQILPPDPEQINNYQGVEVARAILTALSWPKKVPTNWPRNSPLRSWKDSIECSRLTLETNAPLRHLQWILPMPILDK